MDRQRTQDWWMAAAAAFALLAGSTANAAVIHVPGDFAGIQEALDAAGAGDRIEVGPGTWVENIVWPPTLGIQLVGSGMGVSIIDGGDVGRTVEIDPAGGAGHGRQTVLEGFTITGGHIEIDDSPFWGGGINTYDDVTLRNLHVTGNYSFHNGGGIAVSYGANPLVQNVVVSHNLAGNRGGGIYVHGKGQFDHVTVADNAADGYGGGLYFDEALDNVVTNCLFADNLYEDVVVYHTYPPTTVLLDYCLVERGASGLAGLSDGSVHFRTGCISGDPRFVDQGAEDYHLLADSPCIDAGDPAAPLDPDGTRSDIGALPFDQSAAGVAGVPETAGYSLRNVPNPFGPSTTIRFNLAEAADVRLSVYSTTGRLVTRLLDGPLAAGDHSVSWAGTDARGLHVAAGTYFCRLEDANGTEVRRLSVLP